MGKFNRSVNRVKIRNCGLLAFFSLICMIELFSQLPKSALYLSEIRLSGQNILAKDPVYLSDYNKAGYNNQAFFFNYNDIYLTSAIDTHQITDIYRLNLKENKISRITETENISEFSPLPAPDNKHFSVVRIESDRETQSLWMYPLDASNTGYRLFKELNNVGYHAWISKEETALFLVGDPHTLVIANIKTDQRKTITQNIGRCLKVDNEGLLYFVHKISNDNWLLKTYNNKNGSLSTICQMPQGREDFEVLISGIILAGDGAILKSYNKSLNDGWKTVYDYSKYGIKQITRLTNVRDRLVFVGS